MIWADFSKRAALRGNAPAIQNDDGQISFNELLERVGTVAASIGQDQVFGNRRVLLSETEPLALLLAVLACWSRGLVPVISREGRGSKGLSEIREFLGAAATDTGTEIDLHQLQPCDEALVICTSGTTGAPKMVALPAQSVLTNVATIVSELALQPDDLVAVVTPLTYMYGLVGGTLAALWAGATVRFFATDAPLSVVQAAIRQDGVTVVQGPPSLWRLFMAYWNGNAFHSVRIVTTGGERTDIALMNQIAAAFPNAALVLLYGMTEAGPRISHRNFGEIAEGGDGCDIIGKPFAHLDWYVAPIEQGTLPPGTGRLVLRGPTVFLGYLRHGGGYDGLDADGYFHSNDLVRADAEGHLRFVDRYDRIFKSGGKLVSPNEAEAVMLQHAAVKDVACRKETHAIFGFVLIAQVVLYDHTQASIPEIRAHCAANLQPHAIPKRFELRDSLPQAASGKRRSLPDR
jgi:acyl-CoA synthetase (AMP-forming)/AMP-acid ligase II